MGYIEPKTEDDWRAESDARTLAEARVISNDKTRMSSAQKAAANLAQKESEQAKALRAIGGKRAQVSRDYPKRPELWPVE